MSFNIKRIKIKTIKTYFIDVKSAYINLKYENFKMFYNFYLKRIIINIRRL